MKEHVLLLGATGYVGGAFAAYLKKQGVQTTSISRREMDYTRAEVLRSILASGNYTFLVNCAGYTGKPNVDACEVNRRDTLYGNAVFPGVLREVCEEFDLSWGHVSSGCIYTGEGPDGEGFKETDTPNFSFRTNNCSFYSGTKALGEEILEGAEKCYVWRLRIPFSNEDGPRNYLTKLLRYPRLLEAVNSLSHLEDFVEGCWKSWTSKAPYGVYNLTNPGKVTTREVVGLIQEEGVSDKVFQFFESEEEFMKIAAKTPRSNCVLHTEKQEAYGLITRSVKDALRDALRNWKSDEASGSEKKEGSVAVMV